MDNVISKIQGVGYGKAILLGEHFVIYGCPAIVSALDLRTVVRVSSGNGGLLAGQGLNDEQLQQSIDALNMICVILNEDRNNLEFRVESDIPPAKGMGSSAAFCVSCVRALTDFFEIKLSEQRIIGVARQAEDVFHGNSSGMDVAVAALGGLILFKRNEEPVKLKKKLSAYLIIADSGQISSTRKMVESVKVFREERQDVWKTLFFQAQELVKKAIEADKDGDLTLLGRCMNENHYLLQQLGVSSSQLDRMVDVARKAGALGAKLTGGGGGGSVIALCATKEDSAMVRNALEAESFKTYCTVI